MIKGFNIKIMVVLTAYLLSPLCWAQGVGVTKNNLDQNADQSQGNYAPANLNYLGGVGSLGMMQNAWKDPLQHMGEGQSRPGYTKYYWTPELVLPVRVREGMYTLINFPSWEVIENVYIGDGLSFNAQIQGPSSLMVYPEASQFVGVDTNMIVFGRSGNKYVFYMQSETVNTDRITNAIIDIEVVKKKNDKKAAYSSNGGLAGPAKDYSQDGNLASMDATYTRNLQKEDWIENIPVDPTKFRFDIEVYVPNPDDIVIAPERVWRDNVFTYIDLGEKALTSLQRPIVTLIVERSETPVGFRAAGPNNRLIIVEAMGDMVLRSGKRIVCLKLRRADSDGLENTVYAKTNEWDLQTAYASKPEEGDDAPTEFEDVYNNGVAHKPEKNQSGNNAGSDYFSQNTFAGTQAGGMPNGSNIAPTASYESMISDAQMSAQNINGGGNYGYNPAKNKAGTSPVGAGSNTTGNGAFLNNPASFDSIPKITPITAPNSEKGTNTAPKLTGEVNANIGKSELITPEYNNGSLNVNVDFETNNAEPQKPEARSNVGTTIGKSQNNSSPVLIAPKETVKDKNSLISAETEALLKEFRDGKAFANVDESDISIELGTDEDVNNLVKLWNDISKRYSATVSKYQPLYSVDAPADGQGKDVFHLRVGPIQSLEEGDNICSQLGRNGIFCSVVRIQ